MNILKTIPTLGKQAFFAVLGVLLMASVFSFFLLVAQAAQIHSESDFTLDSDGTDRNEIVVDTAGFENLTYTFTVDYSDLDTGETFSFGYIDGSDVELEIETATAGDEAGGPVTVTYTAKTLSAPAGPTTFYFEINATPAAASANDETLITGFSIDGTEIVKTESTVEVTGDTASPATEMGWLFGRDQRTTTPFSFGRSEASLGDGSLFIPPITNTYDGSLGDCNGSASDPIENCDKFIAEYFTGNMPVSDFTSLSYDFFISGNGDSGDANEFYTNVHANFPGNEGAFGDCKFDYVPSSGSVGNFETFSFAATDIPTRVRGAGCPATLAEMPAGSTVFFFALNLGDTAGTDTGLAGYFDQVVLETTTDITTFDFEPLPDNTAPAIAVKDAADKTTVCATGGYDMVSFKLSDNQLLTKLELNGVEKDFTDNRFSDLNFVEPGKFGAVEGINTLVLFDAAGNTTTLEFSLCDDPSSAPIATIKENRPDQREFITTCSNGDYEKISYKLFDQDNIDRVEINGKVKNLTDNKWSDVNFIRPGVFGAVLGENTMIVYDALGNNSTYTFTLCEKDTVKPTIVVDAPEDDLVTGGSFDITVTATDDTELSQVVINLKNGDGSHLGTCLNQSVSDITSTTTSCTVDADTLGNGVFQFKTNARDAEGNLSNTITQTFEIDDSKPVIVVNTPENNFEAMTNFDISVSGTDTVGLEKLVINLKNEDGSHLAPCLNESVGGVVAATSSCTVDVEELGPGTYQFRTNARDIDGNISNTISQTFTIVEPIEASLEITQPLIDGAVLTPGVFEFAAEYIDDDTEPDDFGWAIRSAGACNTNENTVAGNPRGTDFNDPFTYDIGTGTFLATVDMTGFLDGEYCFVVNPREEDDGEDFRETRLFTLETPVLSCTLQSDGNTLVDDLNQYAVVIPEDDESEDWTADIESDWVWAYSEVQDPETDTTYTFSETFSVTGIETALLSIAADNSYRVRVNGQIVPELDRLDLDVNYRDHTTKYDVDISDFLIEGDNEITFEVRNLGVEGSTSRNSSAGLLYRLDIGYTDTCIVTTAPTQPVGIDTDSDDDGLDDGGDNQQLFSTTVTGTKVSGRSGNDDDDEELLSPGLEEAVLGIATSQCVYLKDYMSLNDVNDPWEVTKLQIFLFAKGYDVELTREFDAQTDAAVRAFQADHQGEVLTPWLTAGLYSDDEPSGRVYLLTKWKINDIVCGTNTPMPELR